MSMMPIWYTTTYIGRDACVRHNKRPGAPRTPSPSIEADLRRQRDPAKLAAMLVAAQGLAPRQPRTLAPANPKGLPTRARRVEAQQRVDERPSDRPPPAPCSDVIPGGCFPKRGRRA